MNKLVLFITSALLVSCQMFRGNVPETRDLQSGHASEYSDEDVRDSERDLQARRAEVSRDAEALLAGRYYSVQPKQSARIAGQGCTSKTIEFIGNLVLLREVDFFANNCEGSARAELKVTGKMRVGFLSTEDARKRTMDIEVTRIEAVAQSKGWGFARNQLQPDPCGIRAMNVGEVRNLAGANCGSFGSCPGVRDEFRSTYWHTTFPD